MAGGYERLPSKEKDFEHQVSWPFDGGIYSIRTFL
jgi:hypothetical protein